MPRRKWIDKKASSHYNLVFRPQNDPLIHDESAPQMVLQPTSGPSRIKGLEDLASELGSITSSIRENEGEAANYGIYFDDTEYDYMQHLQGTSGGDETSFFTQPTASTRQQKNNRKNGLSLEEALKRMDLEYNSRAMLGPAILPSQNLPKLSYQAQQNLPDELAGFQPDMDPRLREVLEALQDDAFVDYDEELFNDLTKDGEEVSQHEFDESFPEEEVDGWESDRTVKQGDGREVRVEDDGEEIIGQPPLPTGQDEKWMNQFDLFRKEQRAGGKQRRTAQSEVPSSVVTSSTTGGRRKKRKGALTSASDYSMTSSSLARTEQLTILDARFDKIEEEYNRDDDEEDDEDDDMRSVSAASVTSSASASSVQGPLREDFDQILTDFLAGSRKRAAPNQLAQLDEIRQQLGPALIRRRGGGGRLS